MEQDQTLSQETIEASSHVSVQKGAVRADGKLWLTAGSLHFEPFNKQLGLGPYALARAAIIRAERCWGKGGGVLPLTSEGIEIELDDGSRYQFIVSEPDSWLALLARN
ncbi:hypothetical protein [Gallaecimonas sp. GXIMD4217]|uniref:hypothetical protein n=1 Tax=Gallaecimonas sp. GXIMD4217 TaxID=3131927 RepID=UPI00311B0862